MFRTDASISMTSRLSASHVAVLANVIGAQGAPPG